MTEAAFIVLPRWPHVCPIDLPKGEVYSMPDYDKRSESPRLGLVSVFIFK